MRGAGEQAGADVAARPLSNFSFKPSVTPVMVRIVVTGAAGRMGNAVIGLLSELPGVALAGALEKPGHPALGQPVSAGSSFPRTRRR